MDNSATPTSADNGASVQIATLHRHQEQQHQQQQQQQQALAARRSAANKVIYSAPSSPAAPASSEISSPASGAPTSVNSGNNGGTANNHNHNNNNNNTTTTTTTSVFTAATSSSKLSTPKKNFLDAVMLQTIREKLQTPGGACELQSLRLECSSEPVNVIKDRYLVSAQQQACSIQQQAHLQQQQQYLTGATSTARTITSAVAAAAVAAMPTTPTTIPSYRHLIDLTSSNLKCMDVFTEEQFLCKIINEPLHKVQRAYFQLQQEAENCHSTIYGHPLIRGVHDIVPLSKQRTYVIISQSPQSSSSSSSRTEEQKEDDSDDETDIEGIYEDLHTYIRNKRRLTEGETRGLFHQICQTVQVCHRNGIILRDLKLKRFYFIDEARTKLQYESLEGSMILDDPADDTLSDKIGCPLYTAPELLCPNPTYRGKPADMWSLGVILYTMLVGQYPFYEKGNCNLITIIRHCQVQIPSTLSQSVRWLLLMLLRKNHEDRLEAEYIFQSPWLKEQRPLYMYIAANVINGVARSDDFADDDAFDYEDDVWSSDNEEDDENEEDGMQPLDYTCTVLDMLDEYDVDGYDYSDYEDDRDDDSRDADADNDRDDDYEDDVEMG